MKYSGVDDSYFQPNVGPAIDNTPYKRADLMRSNEMGWVFDALYNAPPIVDLDAQGNFMCVRFEDQQACALVHLINRALPVDFMLPGEEGSLLTTRAGLRRGIHHADGNKTLYLLSRFPNASLHLQIALESYQILRDPQYDQIQKQQLARHIFHTLIPTTAQAFELAPLQNVLYWETCRVLDPETLNVAIRMMQTLFGIVPQFSTLEKLKRQLQSDLDHIVGPGRYRLEGRIKSVLPLMWKFAQGREINDYIGFKVILNDSVLRELKIDPFGEHQQFYVSAVIRSQILQRLVTAGYHYDQAKIEDTMVEPRDGNEGFKVIKVNMRPEQLEWERRGKHSGMQIIGPDRNNDGYDHFEVQFTTESYEALHRRSHRWFKLMFHEDPRIGIEEAAMKCMGDLSQSLLQQFQARRAKLEFAYPRTAHVMSDFVSEVPLCTAKGTHTIRLPKNKTVSEQLMYFSTQINSWMIPEAHLFRVSRLGSDGSRQEFLLDPKTVDSLGFTFEPFDAVEVCIQIRDNVVRVPSMNDVFNDIVENPKVSAEIICAQYNDYYPLLTAEDIEAMRLGLAEIDEMLRSRDKEQIAEAKKLAHEMKKRWVGFFMPVYVVKLMLGHQRGVPAESPTREACWGRYRTLVMRNEKLNARLRLKSKTKGQSKLLMFSDGTTDDFDDASLLIA